MFKSKQYQTPDSAYSRRLDPKSSDKFFFFDKKLDDVSKL